MTSRLFFLALAWPEKLKAIPETAWLKLALALGVLIIGVVLLRILFGAMQGNKLLFSLGALILVVALFSNWVYNRTEPKFLSGFIDKIAPFFPGKDYEVNDPMKKLK